MRDDHFAVVAVRMARGPLVDDRHVLKFAADGLPREGMGLSDGRGMTDIEIEDERAGGAEDPLCFP